MSGQETEERVTEVSVGDIIKSPNLPGPGFSWLILETGENGVHLAKIEYTEDGRYAHLPGTAALSGEVLLVDHIESDEIYEISVAKWLEQYGTDETFHRLFKEMLQRSEEHGPYQVPQK